MAPQMRNRGDVDILFFNLVGFIRAAGLKQQKPPEMSFISQQLIIPDCSHTDLILCGKHNTSENGRFMPLFTGISCQFHRA